MVLIFVKFSETSLGLPPVLCASSPMYGGVVAPGGAMAGIVELDHGLFFTLQGL